MNYIEKTKSFLHQAVIGEQTWRLPFHGLLWEMGTGKSKTIIDSFGRLYLDHQIEAVILVGDKGNYRNWADQIQQHLPDEIPRRVGIWSCGGGQKNRNHLATLNARADALAIVLVNIEAFVSQTTLDYLEKFIGGRRVFMCVDEATSIKNPAARRTKAAKKLGRRCTHRRIATGTPITQSPLDVYAMTDFLQSGCLGFTSFVAFRANFAQMVRMHLGPGRPSFNKVIGYQRLDELSLRLDECCTRITKDECLDLPAKIYLTEEVKMSGAQADAYHRIKTEALLQLEQGLLTSTSALTTLIKLQQIVCGHVRLDDGQIAHFENNRIPALLELLAKLGPQKVIIWCAFQEDVRLVQRALIKAGRKPVCYFGPATELERSDALFRFVQGNATDFVGTQATGGKGLTLVVAAYVIYYSNTFSLEHRLQSEDRAHRIGQHKNVTYIDLVTPGTVDEKLLAAHKAKQDLAHQVLGNMRDLLTG